MLKQLEEINRKDAGHLFKERLLRFYDEDQELFFSNVPGFQKYISCKIKDLDKDERLKDFHYMAITFNKIYTKTDKFKNAFACLIDIDANTEEERDEVLNYLNNNYDKNEILSIITKSPKPISKHRYGCHVLIYCDKNIEKYSKIKKDFNKFDCIDKHLTFYCVKNPMYKYFYLK